jgi:hypothetical protein
MSDLMSQVDDILFAPIKTNVVKRDIDVRIRINQYDNYEWELLTERASDWAFRNGLSTDQSARTLYSLAFTPRWSNQHWYNELLDMQVELGEGVKI